ncbi:hypothetical protein [Mariprofundus micogutta]|nr:hypothetical protein [Mariprofundus micogutta]
MKDMHATGYPNVVDIIVAVLTCLVVLILAFPLYADAQGCTKADKVEVSKVNVPAVKMKAAKTKQPEKQARAVKAEKKSVKKVAPAAPAVAGAVEKIKPEKAKEEPVAVDMETLKKRLKETDAIGVFTKLAIRSDIVDLVDEINRHRKQSRLEMKMANLRASFDGLLLKIVALLEGDPVLSRDLYVSRESIWKSLLEVKA